MWGLIELGSGLVFNWRMARAGWIPARRDTGGGQIGLLRGMGIPGEMIP